MKKGSTPKGAPRTPAPTEDRDPDYTEGVGQFVDGEEGERLLMASLGDLLVDDHLGLRETLEKAVSNEGCSLGDLTVLATANDPFRVDTPARHRDGEWLANRARELGLSDRTIHLRGLHYSLLGTTKPDGSPYVNDEAHWTWLGSHPAKAARWLGYIPFDQIVDQRNAAPVIRKWTAPNPEPYIGAEDEIPIPSFERLLPRVEVRGFAGIQPYKLVLFGEKSSLDDVLGPIANWCQADLYLPTGEISDTLLHQMSKTSRADGRPMVVFTFSDCDPAGWQMPISIARKLQALKVLYPDQPHFLVRRVALTPDQVREYGLPSAPLKDSEKRGDYWVRKMGVEQTEIDALGTLRPDLLRTVARQAIGPYFDQTLADRVRSAQIEWQATAQVALEAHLSSDEWSERRTNAEYLLELIRDQVAEIGENLRIDSSEFEFPPIVVPTAEIDDRADSEPLIDSRWSFVEQSRRLIQSKRYSS